MWFYLLFCLPLVGFASPPAILGLFLLLTEGYGHLRILAFLPLAGVVIGLSAACILAFVVQGAFPYTFFPFAGMGVTLGYCVLLVFVPVAWLFRQRGGRLTLDVILLAIAMGSVAAVVGMRAFVVFRDFMAW